VLKGLDAGAEVIVQPGSAISEGLQVNCTRGDTHTNKTAASN
jgi:hypothetical protein